MYEDEKGLKEFVKNNLTNLTTVSLRAYPAIFRPCVIAGFQAQLGVEQCHSL